MATKGTAKTKTTTKAKPKAPTNKEKLKKARKLLEEVFDKPGQMSHVNALRIKDCIKNLKRAGG